MIDTVIIILGLVCAFFVGMLIAGLSDAAELPPEMSFLNDYPILASGVCTEKATGRQFLCDYKISPEGVSYLIIYDDKELYEIIKSGVDGVMETIFKTAKKLRL